MKKRQALKIIKNFEVYNKYKDMGKLNKAYKKFHIKQRIIRFSFDKEFSIKELTVGV